MELVNETVQRYRDWGYHYYIVDRARMLQHSAWLVLPQDSFFYRARISNRIEWIVQVPIGHATSEFLLHHGHAVIKPLPSIVQRSQGYHYLAE